ncbi:hypothetical protein OIU79_024937 [Salix purpurea]|uniref:Uncharacterized protein n=1 Tax=Salix purpurea TaxID=77065 RepID=A0A9Q1A6S3_SALPP|nr:hypothetical protein OIU79_024937 [Salix purpurea]
MLYRLSPPPSRLWRKLENPFRKFNDRSYAENSHQVNYFWFRSWRVDLTSSGWTQGVEARMRIKAKVCRDPIDREENKKNEAIIDQHKARSDHLSDGQMYMKMQADGGPRREIMQ